MSYGALAVIGGARRDVGTRGRSDEARGGGGVGKRYRHGDDGGGRVNGSYSTLVAPQRSVKGKRSVRTQLFSDLADGAMLQKNPDELRLGGIQHVGVHHTVVELFFAHESASTAKITSTAKL